MNDNNFLTNDIFLIGLSFFLICNLKKNYKFDEKKTL